MFLPVFSLFRDSSEPSLAAFRGDWEALARERFAEAKVSQECGGRVAPKRRDSDSSKVPAGRVRDPVVMGAGEGGEGEGLFFSLLSPY